MNYSNEKADKMSVVKVTARIQADWLIGGGGLINTCWLPSTLQLIERRTKHFPQQQDLYLYICPPCFVLQNVWKEKNGTINTAIVYFRGLRALLFKYRATPQRHQPPLHFTNQKKKPRPQP